MLKKWILLLLMQLMCIDALDALCYQRCFRPCVTRRYVRVCRPAYVSIPWCVFGAPAVYEDDTYPYSCGSCYEYVRPSRVVHRVYETCDGYDEGDYDECEEVFV